MKQFHYILVACSKTLHMGINRKEQRSEYIWDGQLGTQVPIRTFEGV